MKTKLAIIIAGLALAFSTTGCVTSGGLTKKFAELDALGVTKVEITGKFSHTDYEVSREDGVRKAVFVHSNPWVANVKIVRESADNKE